MVNKGSLWDFYSVKAYILIFMIRTILNVKATTKLSERPSITEAPIGLHTSRECFWPSSPYRISKNIVASNMHIGYQMLMDLLELIVIAKGILNGRVSKLF